MKFMLKRVLLAALFYIVAFNLYSATMTSATLCVNGDDITDVWINGYSMGSFNYVNWDSTDPVPCVSVPIAYLNATGGNVIAALNRDTGMGEIYTSWVLDVTYSDGQHAYMSSDDGVKLNTSTYDCSSPPAADWYQPTYNHSSWGDAVVVTGTTWGKQMFDPGTGLRVKMRSYSATASNSGHPCLYMRQNFTLVPEDPPPPPNFTLVKSMSKVSDITTEDVTVTFQICNTGGFTEDPVVIHDIADMVVPSTATLDFQYKYTGAQNTSTGPNFIESPADGDFVDISFPMGFEGNKCLNVSFVIVDYSWQITQAEDNCATANNYGRVVWNGGSRNSNTVEFDKRCWTNTPTFTRTFTPTATFTRTFTHTYTLTPTRTPTFTQTPTRTYTNTNSPTYTRTYTATFTNTNTNTATFTRTPTFTNSPTNTFTNTNSPTNTSTNTHTYTRTFTNTFTNTHTFTNTPTNTFTPTQTFTRTYTNTFTETYTVVPSATATNTFTSTNTRTYTYTHTNTNTPTSTNTFTDTYTVVPSATATNTFTNTNTRTYTYTHTNTNTPTNTNTFTETYTAVPSATVTNTFTNTNTRTNTNTPTNTNTFTHTNTVPPSSTVTNTFTNTNTRTYTNTPTETFTFTNTYTSTDTRTHTPTRTNTNTYTATTIFTNTNTHTNTFTPTFTRTFTNTRTNTNTPTDTNTPTNTYTATFTRTFTNTRTYTNTPTDTNTPTNTYTPTYTRTFTNTRTHTNTPTVTSTFTQTYTRTFTRTFTNTRTHTFTRTHTNTATNTNTFTPTVTNTFTKTFTNTVTYTFTNTFTRTHTHTPIPTPADLEVKLSVTGENPLVGSEIKYRMVVTNKSGSPAYNITINDVLPPGTSFRGTDFRTASDPVVSGGTVTFVLDPSYVLEAGKQLVLEFSLTLDAIHSDSIDNSVTVNWNDSVYNAGQNPNTAFSEIAKYPLREPIVFPNPFSKSAAKDGVLKVANMVPQSVFVVYTITGEHVRSIKAESTFITWDVKNGNGADVSAGIYMYMIRNNYSKQLIVGKIFIQN